MSHRWGNGRRGKPMTSMRRFRASGMSFREASEAGDAWIKAHFASCTGLDRESAVITMPDGRKVRLAPGYDDNFYSTVGGPTSRGIRCKACGASWRTP